MRFAAAILILSGAAACASQIPRPGPADAERAARRWPEATLASLESGRKLYVGRCSGCHTLYRPDYYRGSRWDEAVVEMGRRGRLSAAEELLVRRYLAIASEDSAADGGKP